MVDDPSMVASKRKTGTAAARAMRREGRLPAVVYGNGRPTEAVSLRLRDFELLFGTGHVSNMLINLDIDGRTERVITRDVQLHPVHDTILHADFMHVARGSRITVDVPVRFENEHLCPGLKSGGVLNVVLHAVQLDCPEDAIPDDLVVDLSALRIGESIHVSDLSLPPGVRLPQHEVLLTVVTLTSPSDAADPADDAESTVGGGDTGGKSGGKGA